MCLNVDSSLTHDSQILETVQVPFHRRDKQAMIFAYNGTVLSSGGESASGACNNVGVSRAHLANPEEPETEEHAACSLSHRSCPTLPEPVDCGPPGSSVHGIFQTRILEWAVSSPPGHLSDPGTKNHICCSSCIVRWILYHCTTQEAQSMLHPSL